MIGIRLGIRLGISINRNPEAMAGHPKHPRAHGKQKKESQNSPKFEREKRKKN